MQSKKSTCGYGIMRNMEIPITQSEAWQVLQRDLKEESFLKSEEHFHYLAILKSTPVGNYLYLPYGPVYTSQKGFTMALKSLVKLAKEKNAIFIRVEPRDPDFTKYAPQNTQKSHDLNPKETWLLDLPTPSLASNSALDTDLLSNRELKAKLPSRLLRYYKSAPRAGLTITTSHDQEDIKYLLKLQRTLANKKGINTFSENYLKTELKQPFATLYLTKHQGIVVAAGLVFDDATTRYNLQGAQSEEGRSLHATGILTIQLILDAYKKGLSTFDFWGVAPEGAPSSHPWAGFTAFKKTFKGREQAYAGDYDIILNPAKYRLYQLTRKVNRLIRKS